MIKCRFHLATPFPPMKMYCGLFQNSACGKRNCIYYTSCIHTVYERFTTCTQRGSILRAHRIFPLGKVRKVGQARAAGGRKTQKASHQFFNFLFVRFSSSLLYCAPNASNLCKNTVEKLSQD